MKRIATFAALLIFTNLLFAQKTYVPDNNFEQALIELGYDSGTLDDSVSTSSIKDIASLDIKGKNISDLTGIEGFLSLTRLECSDNNLTNLDLNYNVLLTQLTCANNHLTSLDVSHCPDLNWLWCSTNQLSNIDVSNNLSLESLYCEDNKLTSINISKNTELYGLGVGGNQLSDLDVVSNQALNNIFCANNHLTSLDLSQNISLTSLFCSGNQLTSIDLSHNSSLTTLFCSFNLLTSLDVSHNPMLQMLICNADGNQITSLDLSNNPSLTWLDCTANPLGSLDVSHNLQLENLKCDKTELTSLDVSKNIALKSLYCSSNRIDSLDLTKNVNLTDLNCEGNGMTKLSLINDKVLNYLYCANNKLIFESLETIVESLAIADSTQNNVRAERSSTLNKNNYWNAPYFKSSTIGSEMFHYAPQDSLGYKKTISKKAGESFSYGFHVGGKHSSYQWYKDGVMLPSQRSATLNFTALSKKDAGNYTLHVKNTLLPALTLYSQPMSLKVDENTGNNELPNLSFSFYPNPVKDRLIINTGQECVVVIFDLSGKTIMKRNMSNGVDEIDISAIAPGQYIIKLISESTTYTSKFVKI